VLQLNTPFPLVFKTSHKRGIAAIKKQAWVVAIGEGLSQHIGFDFIAVADDPELSDVEKESRLHKLCSNLNLSGIYGPSILHHLSEDGLVPQPDINIQIKMLREEDEPNLRAFKQQLALSPEYTLTQPDLFPYAIGCFDDGALVAVGTTRIWENTIAEVFLDTLENYRSRGLGRYLGMKVTEWILANTAWIPQYDSEVTNGASLKVAAHIGFYPYGKFFITGSGLMMSAP